MLTFFSCFCSWFWVRFISSTWRNYCSENKLCKDLLAIHTSLMSHAENLRTTRVRTGDKIGTTFLLTPGSGLSLIFRFLHGKFWRTIFTHEFVFTKRTSEWFCERVRYFQHSKIKFRIPARPCNILYIYKLRFSWNWRWFIYIAFTSIYVVLKSF